MQRLDLDAISSIVVTATRWALRSLSWLLHKEELSGKQSGS